MASSPAGSPPAPSGSQNGSPPPPTSEGSKNQSSPPAQSSKTPPPSPSPPPPASPPPSPPKSPPSSPPSSPPPAPSTSSSPPPPSSSPPPPPDQDSPSLPSPSKGDSSSPPKEDSSTPSPPENSDNPASPSPPTSPTTPGASPAPPSKTPSSPTPPTFGPPTSSGSNPPGNILSPPLSVPNTPPSSSTNSTTRSTPQAGSNNTSVRASSSNVNVGVVAGVSAAGIVVVAAFVVVFFMCSRRKRRQAYYVDPAVRPKEQYYNGTSQWRNPQEHVVKLHGTPGVPGTPVSDNGGWGGPAATTQPFPTNHHISGEYSSGLSGQNYSPMPPQSPLGGFSKSQFSYEELAAATAGFSQSNLLGQGGFGFVHKGVLPDGKVVAVKSLKSGSGQGEREFQAEVEIISRIHHRHLVSLVGYSITEGQRMLVYEYVPNKTLEFHLHGKGQSVMDWRTRVRIALGSAKGLAYLHEDCHPRIIHRDIKAANILLDNNFEAMVADFGLAKLTSDNYTHVSTRVMGTFGYLAPEYASSGKLTEKSDVFSFGVMLLELITGRRPVDTSNRMMEDSLVDWARPLLSKAIEDGNYDSLADPRLEGNYVPNEMAHMVSCAAASIRHSARRRPKMSQIVRSLEGDSLLEDINEGAKTGRTSGSSQGNSSVYDTGAYNADMMKFRQMVMSSQEMGSSEYGGTGEFGSNTSTTLNYENSNEMGNSGSKTRNSRAI